MEQKENVKHKLKTGVTPTTTFSPKKILLKLPKISYVDNYGNLIDLIMSDQNI